MGILVAGLLLFMSFHLVPTLPALRARLVARLGENAYKGGYALLALLGLVLVVIGKGRAEFIALWDPPAWGRHVTHLVMLPAIFALGAANAPSNLKRLTPHPMLWGVILWAGGHLLANGDLASLLLFGSFLVYALYDIPSANRRGARRVMQRQPLRADIVLAAISLAVYAVLLMLHPYLFGVALVNL